MASLFHLSRRFFGSLRPGGPPEVDRAWVATVLTEREYPLWERLSGPDRRHSAVVARRVERALGHEATDQVLAAALLHDVGKSVARLRTYGRVIATVSAGVAGRDMAAQWSRSRGFVRRVGLYLRHDELGAELLELADSDPVVVAWAREHHLPPDQWSIPRELADVLKACDDD